MRDGALGAIRLVQVEYIQSGLATRVEDGPQNNRFRWILDPRRSGLALVMSAIGCHAQHLASFASGPNVARVVADVGALMPGRKRDRLRVGAGRASKAARAAPSP